MKKYGLVCNDSSGTAVPSETIVDMFKKHDINIQVFDVKSARHKLIDQVQSAGINILIASGGDGTVNSVAGLALDTGSVLGVLPTGTFNHFTKDLGLPQDLESAVHVIAQGKIQKLDYATVNGKVFVNSSSIGSYPKAVLTREDLRPKLSKMVAMAVAVFRVARQNRALKVRLKINGSEYALKTPSVFVGNNEFEMSGIGVPVRRTIQSGKLCVYVVKSGRLHELLITGLQLLVGKQHSKLRYFETTEGLTILADHVTTNVSLDGEVELMDFPLEYTMFAGGLRVLVSR